MIFSVQGKYFYENEDSGMVNVHFSIICLTVFGHAAILPEIVIKDV